MKRGSIPLTRSNVEKQTKLIKTVCLHIDLMQSIYLNLIVMKKLCIILLVFSLMLSGCSWFRGQEDAVMEKKATVTEQEDTVVGKDAKLYRG